MRSNHLPPGPEPEREPPSDDGANALPSAAEPSPEAVLAAATASGTTRRRRSPAAALLVALGILLTRLFGLVRARVQAQYLGTSIAADALTAATRREQAGSLERCSVCSPPS